MMSIATRAVSSWKNCTDCVTQPTFEIAHGQNDVISMQHVRIDMVQTCCIGYFRFPRHYDPDEGESL